MIGFRHRFGPLRWRDAVAQRGFTTLLLVALLVSVLAVALTQALVSASRGGPDAQQQLDSLRAHYLAESGLEFVQSVISFEEYLSGASANSTCTSNSLFSPSVINALSGYGITLSRTANSATRTCTVESVGCVGAGCAASESQPFAQRRVSLQYMLAGTRGFAESASTYNIPIRNTSTSDVVAILGLAYNPQGATAACTANCSVTASPPAYSSGWFWNLNSGSPSTPADQTASQVFAVEVGRRTGNAAFNSVTATLDFSASGSPVSRDGVVTALLFPKKQSGASTLNDYILGVGRTNYAATRPTQTHSTNTNPVSYTVADGYRGDWCKHATSHPSREADLLAFVVSGDSTGTAAGYTQEITSVSWDVAAQSGAGTNPQPRNLAMSRLTHYPDLSSSCTPLDSDPDGCSSSPQVGFDNSAYTEIFYLYNPPFRGRVTAIAGQNNNREYSITVRCNSNPGVPNGCGSSGVPPKVGTYLKVLEYAESGITFTAPQGRGAGRLRANTRIISVQSSGNNSASFTVAVVDPVTGTPCPDPGCSQPLVALAANTNTGAILCGGVCALLREANTSGTSPTTTQFTVTRSSAGQWAGGFLCLRTGGDTAVNELSAFSGRIETRDWAESITP